MASSTERKYAPDSNDPDITRLFPDGNKETDQMDLFKDEQARLAIEKEAQAKAEAQAIALANKPIREQYAETGVFNASMAHEIYMHYTGKKVGETPRPEMDLSFLKELNDPEAAAVITKYKGIINLDGLEHLSWEVATVLNDDNAFVFLRGLKSVNERVLRVLQNIDRKTRLVASEDVRAQLDALYQKDVHE
ncbi:MAG: hypothetical protein ACYC5G_00525 [Candidatus Doudnabacteria bacterium]